MKVTADSLPDSDLEAKHSASNLHHACRIVYTWQYMPWVHSHVDILELLLSGSLGTAGN